MTISKPGIGIPKSYIHRNFGWISSYHYFYVVIPFHRPENGCVSKQSLLFCKKGCNVRYSIFQKDILYFTEYMLWIRNYIWLNCTYLWWLLLSVIDKNKFPYWKSTFWNIHNVGLNRTISHQAFKSSGSYSFIMVLYLSWFD